MKTINIEYLSYSSYRLLCAVISVFIGVVACALFFVADVLGMDTSIQLGLLHFNDTETGLVVLLVGPFIFGTLGCIGSFFSYWLFLWGLRAFNDLT